MTDNDDRTGDDRTATVADVGEFGLIERVRPPAEPTRAVLLGSGDDAAHLQTRDGSFVMTSDLLLEGRHFRRDWSTAHDVGRKAAAANLSDVNAMGGVATALTVALGLPGPLPAAWVMDLARGMTEECAQVGATIVGGDITEADQIVVAVTAVGEATRLVTRAGATAGDVVAFAGELGLAGAGFAALSRGFRSPKAAVDKHRVPAVPYPQGPRAAAAGATAMIDVSDGLLADAAHLATAGGVTIELDSSRLEVPEPVATVAEALGVDPARFLLTGGDDYALLATFPGAEDLPEGWTLIGGVGPARERDEAVVLVDGLEYDGPQGHRHFA